MRLALAAALLLAAPSALAQETVTYDGCIETALAQPSSGLSMADGWHARGGGDAALHCRAMALASLGSFAEAARGLDTLAQGTPDAGAQADLWTQAGDFHMAASDPDTALSFFDRALTADAQSVEALDGRARVKAARRDFAGAIEDLNRLMWLSPGDAEALALRAAARRQSGDAAGALADADAAIVADPASALAYFERGAARAVSGDRAGARTDWTEAERLDPTGEFGRLAATNRAKLPY